MRASPQPRLSVVDERLIHLLFAQLGELELFTQPRNAAALAAWRQAREVPDWLTRWLDESLRLLSEHGYVRAADGSVQAERPALLDRQGAWDAWEKSKEPWLADPQLCVQVTLLEEMLRALPQMLTGRKAATDILFPQASMERVAGIYKNNPVADYFNEALSDELLRYLESRIAVQPTAKLRILEVGAGTGGTSAAVFARLQPLQRHVAEYCYSDLSQAFLMHARERFGPQNPYLQYRLLNVERPLQEQGLSPGVYDVVIASNVLHATTRIRETLRNVKAALARGGILLLNEIAANSPFMHLTFGLLRGWWLHEDAALRVPGCPALSPQTWARVLESEGFEAVSFPVADAHGLGQQIVSARSNGIVRQRRKTAPVARVDEEPVVVTREEPKPVVVVSDSSAAGNDLAGLLDSIRACVAGALKLKQQQIDDRRNFADYGVDSIVAVGLANAISKQCGITLPTTAIFDYNSVAELARHLFEKQGPAKTPARVEPSKPVSQSKPASSVDAPRGRATRPTVRGLTPAPVTTASPFRSAPAVHGGLVATYQKALLERPGGIDDLKIVTAQIDALGAEEVRIAVHAFSLNFGDLLCVKGLYPTMPPYPFTPGMEVSGIVVEAGEAVSAVRVGDAVVASAGETFGGHATMIKCPQGQVWSKPEALSFEEACSLPAVAITMLDAFRKAQLRPGESILIQTATGGTGLIAVQLAQHLGAEIYATAGSPAKLDYLAQLGVQHCIDYRELDFAAEVRRLTQGRGVDVIINTLGGDAMQKGLNCLAPGGRYIEIAMTALKSARSVDLSVLNHNQAFFSIDLRRLAASKPDLMVEYRNQLNDYVARGIIRPTLGEVVSFERLHDAYRRLEDRANVGKIVVSVPEARRFHMSSAALLPSQEQAVPLAHALQPETDGIAIIGLSGRFPQAQDVEELWRHLAQGNDLTEEVSRWNLSPSSADAGSCNRGGFLRDIDRFDAQFFGLSSVEAACIDPQQRLFLEESWKALEDAGYAGAGVEGCRCGVYVGCSGGDYAQLLGEHAPAQAFWGNASSVIPARIAYHLNLQGPAIAVDTACSSSLVALHVACQGLRLRETDMALAGGVFVQATPRFYRLANRAGMLSAAGLCRSFDAQADGFVPAEAVGAVVLKRLSDALRDRDHIYGVVRGSGVSQNGKAAGITTPSSRSQERLARHVYERFGIHPDKIQMIEAQGTGTKLGDPIEHQALAGAFRGYTDRKGYCALGSIKTNLGHSGTAAGVVSVIKVLLSLKHKQMPASLHFQAGNAGIDFAESPFFINTSLRDWHVAADEKRCAAVNAFGFSGTNAHAVIEEAPVPAHQSPVQPAHLIVLSARTAEQLTQQVERLVQFVERLPAIDLNAAAYTLLAGRRRFNHRFACVARDRAELLDLSSRWLAGDRVAQVYVSQVPEGGRREHAPLKDFGNACIEQCRQPLAPDAFVEKLAAVAELFTQGYELAFDRLFAPEQCVRISLPTYPFARDLCWTEPSHAASLIETIPASQCDPGVPPTPQPFLPEEPVATLEKIAADSQSPVSCAVQSMTTGWEPKAIPATAVRTASGARWIVLVKPSDAKEHDGYWHEPAMSVQIDNAVFRVLASAAETADERFTECVLQLLVIGKEVLAGQGAAGGMVQLVVPRDDERLAAAASGMLRSMSLECPALQAQVIAVAPTESAIELTRKLQLNALLPADREVRYERDQRLVATLQKLDGIDPSERELPWKARGVYLLAGGGCPAIATLTDEIAKHAPGATLLCIGSEPSDSARYPLQRIEAAGARAAYHELDLTDASAVERFVTTVRECHGSLDGIIYCAGPLWRGLIAAKMPNRFAEVMVAEMSAVTNLDQATREAAPEFFLLLSSKTAATAGPGYADHAAIGAFMDGFAMSRNIAAARGERDGRTLSVGWPVWDNAAGEAQVDSMQSGATVPRLDAIQEGAILEALYDAYSSGQPCIEIRRAGALENTVQESRARKDQEASTPDAPAHHTDAPVTGDSLVRAARTRRLREALRLALSTTVSELVKLPVAKMDAHADLLAYGFDSIRLADFGRTLKRRYGFTLTLQTFFEHPTIAALCDHFIETQPVAAEAAASGAPQKQAHAEERVGELIE